MAGCHLVKSQTGKYYVFDRWIGWHRDLIIDIWLNGSQSHKCLRYIISIWI